MTTRKTITQGPSKFDLMVALFDQGRTVEFSFDYVKTEVLINSVEKEDGSCDKFLISGYISTEHYCWQWHGYYDLQRRGGWIDLKDD